MDTKTLEFDPLQALTYAATIARPRLVGTDAEKEVGHFLCDRLESFGFQVQPEEFRFSDSAAVFLAFEIAFSLVLVILTIVLHVDDNPLQYITALLLILFFLLTSGMNRLVHTNSLAPRGNQKRSFFARQVRRVGRKFQTTNYVARLPGQPRDPSGIFLTLVAHYDSKSQRMPLLVRIALFTLGIASMLLFGLLVLLSALLPALSAPALILGGFGVLAGIPLLFLDLGNESPGAIDNASSVGVVLHLAEVLSKHPEICHKLNLTVLLTSAEEISTIGALEYVQRHGAQLRQQARQGHSFILNYDSVGVDGPMFWVGSKKEPACSAEKNLICLVRETCNDLGLELKRLNLPGALYDHIPFAEAGLDTCTLVAVNRKTLSVHTPQDTVEQLGLRGFTQAGQISLRVIDRLLDGSLPARKAADIGIEKPDI